MLLDAVWTCAACLKDNICNGKTAHDNRVEWAGVTEFQSLLKSSGQSWILNLSQENNHFLQCISLPIPTPSDSFPGGVLRSEVIHRVRLLWVASRLSLCSTFQREDWAPADLRVSEAVAGRSGCGGDWAWGMALWSCWWISVPWLMF